MKILHVCFSWSSTRTLLFHGLLCSTLTTPTYYCKIYLTCTLERDIKNLKKLNLSPYRLQHSAFLDALLNAKQVAQLSQRNRAAGWVSYGQKWKIGTGRQYLRTIYQLNQKKSPYTTFVDITAMHGNFCTKFYTIVKRSNIHFITKFY